jgi:PAS domain-containing protein
MPETDDQTITYSLDFITGELHWGDALYTTYGYDHAQSTNSVEWWTDHIHPEDAMILNQAMDKLLDPSISEWAVTYRFRRADNSYLPMQDHAAVVRDEQGVSIRLVGSLTPASQNQPPTS